MSYPNSVPVLGLKEPSTMPHQFTRKGTEPEVMLRIRVGYRNANLEEHN